MIVLLNGTSSAGKTSLAKAMQSRWDGPLLAVGIDTAQFEGVYGYAGYDVEVDTSLHDPDGCAALVTAAAAGHRGPTRLASRR